ncbi:MAG: hypothetical protein COB98_01470 [Flavobacteriaceae bacterium]|nr:MAG: hypothetical protein COB98_01470 [Flavobacteriaceae bacterium]
MIVSPTKITYFFLLVLCFACTKSIDTDQLDDASFESTYLFTLVHLSLKAPKFLDEFNQEIPVTSDMVKVPDLDDLSPYLKRAEFTVETENSFNRNFTLNIFFYDINKKLIYTLKPVIIVPAKSGKLSHILTIPENEIKVLDKTHYFGMNISLWHSTSGKLIKATDPSEFILKSSLKLVVNLNKA